MKPRFVLVLFSIFHNYVIWLQPREKNCLSMQFNCSIVLNICFQLDCCMIKYKTLTSSMYFVFTQYYTILTLDQYKQLNL